MDHLEDIVKEFLVESYENLDQLDQDLLALEDSPEDRDRLASIFRTIHTIKGTSGFLALPKLEHVTHVGESLLVPLRDGEISLTNEMTGGLLSMIDAVRQILGHIETSGSEGDDEYSEVVSRLEQLRANGGKSTVAVAGADDVSSVRAGDVVANASEGTEVESPPAKVSPTISATEPPAIKRDPETLSSPAIDSLHDVSKGGFGGGDRNDASERGTSLADTTVRLDVELLDRLMNLVGELVLARNQILQFSRSSDDSNMAAASQRLNLITSELQEGVMKTRMQPIQNAWSKIPRVVRDLSFSCGKKVQVRTEGAETEMDKTILEAIKDPLTHIVRNSVDHGIERPDVRRAAGKPEEGTLWLRAFHEGGQVNIEIGDDGGGINVERVRDKAISRNLVTPERAAAMNERELMNLILLPGFSTAETVTNVSGRGVGMDVVKTNVERIGGTLDIHSVQGQGTTLRIKIPLTLAIVPALIVTCKNDRYAIPQVSLLELVRLEGDRARREIELLHNVPTYRLRGSLLPLLYLDEQLRLVESDPTLDRRSDDVVNIVVLQADDRQFGLVVDQINDTQEIVVKPLSKQLKSIPIYAGATIMGDGAVSLILDVNGLAEQGRVLSEHHDQTIRNARDAHQSAELSSDRASWLIVESAPGTRAAIPLGTVARLEEFSRSMVETSGHAQVVQYRNLIMPLVDLAAGGYGSTFDDNTPLQVVVYQEGEQAVGVIVNRIVDVVDHAPKCVTGTSTILPTQIIGGRVTEILDLRNIVQAHLMDANAFGLA